jgi:hypothetical protein
MISPTAPWGREGLDLGARDEAVEEDGRARVHLADAHEREVGLCAEARDVAQAFLCAQHLDLARVSGEHRQRIGVVGARLRGRPGARPR